MRFQFSCIGITCRKHHTYSKCDFPEMELRIEKDKEEDTGDDHLKSYNILKHACENINLHV